MFGKVILHACLSLGLAVAIASPALAEATAPVQAAALTTSATDIGTLLDNPDAKAVLAKHLPGFANNPQIEMARAMTLKQIQGFAGDQITDEVLAKIDADLAKIPAKH